MRSKTFEEVAKRHFFEFFFGFSLKGLRPLNNPEGFWQSKSRIFIRLFCYSLILFLYSSIKSISASAVGASVAAVRKAEAPFMPRT